MWWCISRNNRIRENKGKLHKWTTQVSIRTHACELQTSWTSSNYRMSELSCCSFPSPINMLLLSLLGIIQSLSKVRLAQSCINTENEQCNQSICTKGLEYSNILWCIPKTTAFSYWKSSHPETRWVLTSIGHHHFVNSSQGSNERTLPKVWAAPQLHLQMHSYNVRIHIPDNS
jgi:hypothetical protein